MTAISQHHKVAALRTHTHSADLRYIVAVTLMIQVSLIFAGSSNALHGM